MRVMLQERPQTIWRTKLGSAGDDGVWVGVDDMVEGEIVRGDDMGVMASSFGGSAAAEG